MRCFTIKPVALSIKNHFIIYLSAMWTKFGESILSLKLWCWRRLLWVPWTARRSNQLILKEVSPEYSLEGLMLKLKLQYFDHLIWRTDSLENTLMLGKIEGSGEGDDRGWDCWMASLTQCTWVWANLGSWWWTGKPGVLRSLGSQRVGHDWATKLAEEPVETIREDQKQKLTHGCHGRQTKP